MRLKISHTTSYHYEWAVKSVIQYLRLTPRDHIGQRVLRWRIEPDCDGQLLTLDDSLGNIVSHFTSDQPIQELIIKVAGEIETEDHQGLVSGTVERAPCLVFLRDTPLTLADDAIRAYIEDIVASSVARKDTLAILHLLLQSLHATIVLDTEPTHSATTAIEAFALKRGVCQDLTHIFIACARHLTIPARYVSGYFFRSDGIVAQDAGHAWAEAYIEDLGWVGFDPTNGICVGSAHVRTAIGLDYLGAAPIRGARFGGGKEKLDVAIVVESAQAQQ